MIKNKDVLPLIGWYSKTQKEKVEDAVRCIEMINNDENQFIDMRISKKFAGNDTTFSKYKTIVEIVFEKVVYDPIDKP